MKKIKIRWIILAFSIAAVWIIMIDPSKAEWYAQSVYPYWVAILSRISSPFPISVGDCFIYGSITGLLAYAVYAIVKRKPFLTTVGRMSEYLAWVYVWFYLAWGLNYFRYDFYERTDIAHANYSKERFQSFLDSYTDSLNALFVPMDTIDKQLVRTETNRIYKEIGSRFHLLKPSDYFHPKPMLISSLMSKVGVLGYLGPFFNEYNLNSDLLAMQYPSTYAHEMAHILGIASEAEANLYSFLVCSRSTNPQMRFSAYLSLLSYVLGNAYMSLPEEEVKAWTSRIRPEIKELHNRKSDYWNAKYSPLIGKAQDKLYDLFLKGNNISSGRQNYSEVIGLLISYNALP